MFLFEGPIAMNLKLLALCVVGAISTQGNSSLKIKRATPLLSWLEKSGGQ